MRRIGDERAGSVGKVRTEDGEHREVRSRIECPPLCGDADLHVFHAVPITGCVRRAKRVWMEWGFAAHAPPRRAASVPTYVTATFAALSATLILMAQLGGGGLGALPGAVRAAAEGVRRSRARHNAHEGRKSRATAGSAARDLEPYLVSPRTRPEQLRVIEAGCPSFSGCPERYGCSARPGGRSRSARASAPSAAPVSPQPVRGCGRASCSPSGRGRCR